MVLPWFHIRPAGGYVRHGGGSASNEEEDGETVMEAIFLLIEIVFASLFGLVILHDGMRDPKSTQ
jgi:hypothetical protein